MQFRPIKHGGGFIAVLVFAIAFFFQPYSQYLSGDLVPGNIGDARLNNYFLEHAYQYFAGSVDSLWHLPMFYPYPYVLGFSDNLFGAMPAYAVFRVFGMDPEFAFQYWYVVGFFANFIGAYAAFRILGAGVVGATVGALIFAYALPVGAHSGHAQLQYRFGLPLAISYLTLFLSRRKMRYFLWASFFMTWQFWAGIYIGFYTLLLMIVLIAVHFVIGTRKAHTSIRAEVLALFGAWSSLGWGAKAGCLAFLAGCFVALLLLFYPYLQVSHLYHASRSFSEIKQMLPRIQSYFIADTSGIWSEILSPYLPDVPMRHEHQMFPGLSVYALALIGAWIGYKYTSSYTVRLMTGTLLTTMVVTLSVFGASLWVFVHWLPLASSIRAISRIDLGFLFFFGFLAALAADHLVKKGIFGALAVVLAAGLMIAEFANVNLDRSRIVDWRARISDTMAKVPSDLPPDSILFFAQDNPPYFANELDAMWVSLLMGYPTLNGYSGFLPPGQTHNFGMDCTEYLRRLHGYLEFAGRNDEPNALQDYAKRVIPIGFGHCPELTVGERLQFTQRFDALPPELFNQISLEFESAQPIGDGTDVLVGVRNDSDVTIPARFGDFSSIALSWRFLDAAGEPLGGWVARQRVSIDIPSGKSVPTAFYVAAADAPQNGTLQVSFVHEGVFWAHDIGVEPINIKWPLPR